MKIDQNLFNISSRLQNKLNAPVTPESFEEDWNMWSNMLVVNTNIDVDVIMEEIESYDYNTLGSENFDWEQLVHAYNRFMSYNNRVTYFITKISPLHKCAVTAHKNLKDIATDLFTGTDKQRLARATDLVQPFAIKAAEFESLMDFLNQYKETISRAMDTMNRLAIDRQSRAKFNYKMVQESNSFSRTQDDQNNLNSEEEDETIFIIPPKK